MKKSTKIILILAACFIAIGTNLTVIGLLLGASPAKMINFSGLEHSLYDDSYQNNYNKENSYTVNPSGIHEISVDWVVGSVTFEPYEGTEIILEETSSGEITEKSSLGYRIDEGELEISFTKKLTDLSFLKNHNYSSKDLKIKVPADLSAHLTEINIDTVDADVQLNNITAGSLSLNTVNGEIYGTGLTLSEIELDTVDGDLNLQLLNCPGKIEADSIDGNVTIAIPANSGFTASLDSVSGNLSSEFHTDPVKGYFSAGNGSAEFEMDSVSGNFYINIAK